MNKSATAHCSVEHCKRWAYTHPAKRRMALGWFFGRDGSAMCPDHLSGELAEFMAAKP